jgi:hypothetical protein
MHFNESEPIFTKNDERNIEELKEAFQSSFNRLSLNDGRTIEFYYKLGETRGVDGFLYVGEAIKRAGMKKDLAKPISYIASLCKNFYKNGLYSQPSSEENDILSYIEGKIGKVSMDNRRLIQSAISTNGAVRVMAAASEILNNSDLQDRIIEEIVLGVVKIFGRQEK